MNNSSFISSYTSDRCISFLEFQLIAKKYNIYFEKINNYFYVCYDGDGDPILASYNFFKNFFPETDLTPNSFNLMQHISDFHFTFLKDKINEIAKKYSLPPIYNYSISLKENTISLLNVLRPKSPIRKEDMEIIKYILSFN